MPTTGFKVQPPMADFRSKMSTHQSGRMGSCAADDRHPTQGLRPQFDQANWYCRPNAGVVGAHFKVGKRPLVPICQLRGYAEVGEDRQLTASSVRFCRNCIDNICLDRLNARISYEFEIDSADMLAGLIVQSFQCAPVARAKHC